MNETGPVWWIFSQYCGYWWHGALARNSTMAPVATDLRLQWHLSGANELIWRCLISLFPGVLQRSGYPSSGMWCWVQHDDRRQQQLVFLWMSRIWTTGYGNSCWVELIKLEYSRMTRSIPSLLMTWLLTSSGHQKPWYWLCRINRTLFSMRKDFNYFAISLLRNYDANTCTFLCFLK